ncbi:MAG: HD domain-containing protein [Dehalococcoidia bacterium]
MPPLARAAYRTRQVAHALNPRVVHTDLEWARQVLSAAEARLFFEMHKRDQRHALEVARRLRDQAIDDLDLLKAALLHDCGKGDVPVWLRIVKVLHPHFVRRAGDETSGGWRGAAYRLTHHPEIGAHRVLHAGAGETVSALIRGHVHPDDADRLALLIAADDAS